MSAAWIRPASSACPSSAAWPKRPASPFWPRRCRFDIQNSFRNAGLLNEGSGQLKVFRDRDFSIEWCENEILTKHLSTSQKEIKSLPQILNDFHPWHVDTGVLLHYLDRIEAEKNHYLILQGDPARELFFIESGKVKVIIELDNGRTMRVRSMGAGTVVGEIGLYLDQQRLAPSSPRNHARFTGSRPNPWIKWSGKTPPSPRPFTNSWSASWPSGSPNKTGR